MPEPPAKSAPADPYPSLADIIAQTPGAQTRDEVRARIAARDARRVATKVAEKPRQPQPPAPSEEEKLSAADYLPEPAGAEEAPNLTTRPPAQPPAKADTKKKTAKAHRKTAVSPPEPATPKVQESPALQTASITTIANEDPAQSKSAKAPAPSHTEPAPPSSLCEDEKVSALDYLPEPQLDTLSLKSSLPTTQPARPDKGTTSTQAKETNAAALELTASEAEDTISVSAGVQSTPENEKPAQKEASTQSRRNLADSPDTDTPETEEFVIDRESIIEKFEKFDKKRNRNRSRPMR